MRLVAVSDTHNRAESIAIPDGDVLLHAGDLTMKGSWSELLQAARWLRALGERYRAVVAIPGNHDFGAESDPDDTRALFESYGITWLVDEPAVIDGVRFYGSPWQPWFYDWAFNFPRWDGGEAARAAWSRIPHDTDVLITHGPPRGILDLTSPAEEHAGCPYLLDAVRERPAIRAHVFGHIHEGYGQRREGDTLFVNASTCDLRYAPTQPPIAFEVSAAR
ncbi:MAG TPA: metallophosphoesterase family protein [Candidatus Elarobacter sp.]|nr:metallophosphoesterase family protein [Dongiaceae bacterium]HZW52648.1 metallophosphoesterase family protein [Candidatus Elarobacter sp.]